MYKYNLQDSVYVFHDSSIRKGQIIERESVNKLVFQNDRIISELTWIVYTLIFHFEGSGNRYYEHDCFKTVEELKDSIGKSIPIYDDVHEGLFTLPGEGFKDE